MLDIDQQMIASREKLIEENKKYAVITKRKKRKDNVRKTAYQTRACDIE